MKNYKPIAFSLLIIGVLCVIGYTIAYFTTSDSFDNKFYASDYVVEVEETFESPDHWEPGDTTPKEVIATNRSEFPVAVRVKLTPSWEDANGDPLPIFDTDDNLAAIVNFTDNYTSKWNYIDGYYYYLNPLEKDESTTSLLDSVTFNKKVNSGSTTNCQTTNGVLKCTSTLNDYAGGKYKLKVDIETCQYNKYEEIWGVYINYWHTQTLMEHYTGGNYVFDKSISRDYFESINTLNYRDVPPGAIDSWDCSSSGDGSVMCWYKDDDNNGKYELYIGQNGGVKANPNSSYAFHNFRNMELIDLTNFDTTGVTTMASMFDNTGYDSSSFKIIGLENFDTSEVKNMSIMFYRVGYSATTLDIGDISGWDVSKVTNMKQMFQYFGYSTPVVNIGNLSSWDTSSVTDMSYMFQYAGNSSTTFNSIGTFKVYADVISFMFEWSTTAKATLNIYSNPTYYVQAFYGASNRGDAGITVNYASATTNINSIVATKSNNSNVVVGFPLD